MTDTYESNSFIYILCTDEDNSTYVKCPKRAIINSIFEKYIEKISINTILTDNIFEKLIKYVDESTTHLLTIDLTFINKHGIDILLSQYISESNFEKYAKTHSMNNIFTIKYDTFEIRRSRIQMLYNSVETLYWQLSTNCNLNITDKFLKRDIVDTTYANIKANCNIMLSNTKIAEEDYIYNLINGEGHINISSNNNSTYWKSKVVNLTIDDINHILRNELIDDEERYHLIMNLLSSKSHCHLIINNRELLEKIKSSNFVKTHYYIFRYVLSYAWISLTMDEFITKTNMTNDDRFVFDIQTANLLPQMKLNIYNKSPYLPVLISDSVKATKKNLSCPTKIYNASIDYGVCTLETFRVRLNYFICNQNINLFENVDWTNIGICGSVMCCCLPNFNPLFANFMNVDLFNPQDDRFVNFINHHYDDSDIDIACNKDFKQCFDEAITLRKAIEINIRKNISNLIIFRHISYETIPEKITMDVYDETIVKCIDGNDETIVPDKKIYTTSTIEQSINTEDNLVYITPYKTANIYINDRFIKNHLINIDSDGKYDLDNEIENMKSILYTVNNNSVKSEIENTIIDTIYDIYVKEFNRSTSDVNPRYLICNTLVPKCSIRIFYSDRDNNMIYYTHTIKYALTSNYFRIPMELFKCRSDEIIGTVSQFHFPVVRAYYNGQTVKMVPSCIGACTTLMNIDYKFFAGVRDPIVIWIKYYKRGMGFIFNGAEISKFVAFCMKNTEYVKDRNIHIFNASDIVKYLGPKHHDDELYVKSIPATQYVNHHKKYHLTSLHIPQSIFVNLLIAIKKNGNINPFNYHMIITLYEHVKSFTSVSV